jgi:hypothetical protein
MPRLYQVYINSGLYIGFCGNDPLLAFFLKPPIIRIYLIIFICSSRVADQMIKYARGQFLEARMDISCTHPSIRLSTFNLPSILSSIGEKVTHPYPQV